MFNQYCYDCGNVTGPFVDTCNKCGGKLHMKPQRPKLPEGRVLREGSDKPIHLEGHPNDFGAKVRFDERKKKLPSFHLAFWWVVHNCIAHPVIGLLPFKACFDFHDYTAKKIGSDLLEAKDD